VAYVCAGLVLGKQATPPGAPLVAMTVSAGGREEVVPRGGRIKKTLSRPASYGDLAQSARRMSALTGKDE
jgi:hypothetical protein